MSVLSAADELGVRGAELWAEVMESNVLDSSQRVILLEACRTVDRLQGLDDVVRGKGVLELMHFRVPSAMDDQGLVTVHLTVDGVLSEARQQANILKQLLVSLRLPDEASGKKPQQRGARGAYKPTGNARVSSLDAARLRASGA